MHVDEGMVMKRTMVWLGLAVVAACGSSEPAGPDAAGAPDARVEPPAMTLELLAGDLGGPGNVDGTGAAARFNDPAAVAVDAAGNAYIADRANQLIRKVTPAGEVTTVAGAPGLAGFADGVGAAARFRDPAGVAVDAAGNLYVADQGNHTIRKIMAGGAVTTLAGLAGRFGTDDGTGAAARFRSPAGLAVDRAGNVFVADTSNQTIRKITAAGEVTTAAGIPGMGGSLDGTTATASFRRPSAIAVDRAGNLFVVDHDNETIREIAIDGKVTTVAGTPGDLGHADGVGPAAQFAFPSGIAVDDAGALYVADNANNTIRKIVGRTVTTLAGRALERGSDDGAMARFASPAGIAVDAAGVVYVVDGTQALRTIAAGVVATRAGARSHLGSADGVGAAARFDVPIGVAADRAGTVYVADSINNTVRKVTPDGTVTTLAGSAHQQGSDDGTGAAARFDALSGIAVDALGNAYVNDLLDNTIRKITPAGVVTTFAGLAGQRGSTDGPGAAARFDGPLGVAVDGARNVYVADGLNHTIRKITPDGVVSTLAGTAGMRGDADGTGAAARFSTPIGLCVDGAGNVYIADTDNHAVRKITSAGVVTTLAGGPTIGSSDGVGAAARFNFPVGVAVDPTGNVYVADTLNNNLRKIAPDGTTTTIGGVAGVADVVLGEDFRLAAPQGLAISRDAIVVSDAQAILALRHGVTP